MKKSVFFITAIGTLMFFGTSCSTKYKQKIEELKAELITTNIAAERQQQYLADSLEWVLNSNLMQIEADINEVLEKEGVIVKKGDGDVEDYTSTKEEIRSRIQGFSQLLESNRNKIDHLISKLQKSESKNAELIASLERTKARLDEQEQTIEELFISLEDERARFSMLDVGFRDLRSQNDSLSVCLGDLDKKVHQAYFVVGDYRELKDKGVVGKDGGILSLGAAHVLEDDFNEEQFSEVDIREKMSVEVRAKKAELITEHPSDSYEFKFDGKEVASLEIKNPEEFWKASKFMVLETN